MQAKHYHSPTAVNAHAVHIDGARHGSHHRTCDGMQYGDSPRITMHGNSYTGLVINSARNTRAPGIDVAASKGSGAKQLVATVHIDVTVARHRGADGLVDGSVNDFLLILLH